MVSAGKSQIIEYHHKNTEISVLQKHNLAYRKKKKIKLMQMLHDGCPVAFLLLLSPSFLSDLNEIEKGLRARSYHTIHLNDVWHSVVSLLTGFPGIAVTGTITNNIHNNI